MEYGFISLLPVLVILIIAVATKRTLFAMTCGLTVGAIILASANEGFVNSWFGYLYASMANESFQWIAMVVAMFGMLIVLFERSNAVTDFGIWAGKFIKTKKQSLFGTFILGVIIFLEDYLNNLAVGTTMKGITDRQGIPRTQLAYVVNAVAAPVCILIPLSSWAAYFAMLMENQGVVVDGTGMGAYLKALPLTFYAYISLIVCVLQIIGIIPKLGLIKKDYERVALTGNVFPEGTPEDVIHANQFEIPEGYQAHPWNFLIPLIVMIVVTLAMGTEVLYGSAAGVLSAFILYLLEKKMSFKELLEACYDGVVSMSFVMILTVLAFAVQAINIDLGLADYVISVTQPIMKGAFLPAVVFLVCGVYAYATGCFWDLAAIILPIVVPLAQAMGVDPILASAAVFSGAAFGSNTCLYGDGVIMCAQGCEIKSMDLMFATLPYATISAAISVVLYLICGFMMV